MIHVHHANRFEHLEALLLGQLQRGGVFDADAVVVPSAAVRRRLTLALADTHGICARVDFAFLARWLWQQIARVVPDVAPESPFDASVLTWRVYRAFGDAGFVAGHPRLAHYLDAADEVMRLELAERVAGLLEQYVTYRPEWLDEWATGRAVFDPAREPAAAADEAWQAALWRRIGQETGAAPVSPGEVFAAALQRLGTSLVSQAGLPARAHVFALPTIAPQHLRWLAAMGRACELHLYVLNPCREYWFDLADPRRVGRDGSPPGSPDGAAAIDGHPLLASWGRQAQGAIELLLEATAGEAIDDEVFVASGRSTLLAQLQDGILALQAPTPGSLMPAEGDRSLEVHVAHSTTRQLEVLHDQLLGMFAEDASLRPADVLVVLPDIEAAAPLIEAVFATATAERRIPFSITGRGRSRASLVARALLSLLSLATSRLKASELFAVLQHEAVARRFGFDDTALADAHALLLAAGLRWGYDGTHRGGFGVPPDERHTLADALQRLFLAYSLPQAADSPFAERLPAALPGDGRIDVDLLGRLWTFADALVALGADLAQPRSAAAWAALLGRTIERFIEAGDDELEDLRDLRSTVRRLADDIERGGCNEALPLPVVRRALEDRLDESAAGGVPTGAVTFTSMTSLRGLPFRVVCVLGLDDGVFPTTQRAAEFDLMAARPRRGDRQRRHDERNLFLDLLLAARDRLLLAYTGRSIRDNAVLPPSVLVSELLDVVVPAITPAGADAQARDRARSRIVVEHPLQPFSRAAFSAEGDPRCRSFDRELAEALREGLLARQAAGTPAGDATAKDAGEGGAERDHDRGDDGAEASTDDLRAPFFASPLPAVDSAWHQPSLADLVAFFRMPCRYLLRRRLGVALTRDEDELEDDEPLIADRRARSVLARRLLPVLLAGGSDDTARQLASAGLELPAGAIGAQALREELASTRRFAERIREATVAAPLPTVEAVVELEVDGQPWRIDTAFVDLRPQGLVRWRHGALRAADRLEAWLTHLVLCAAAPPGVACRTEWHGLDAVARLQPCASAPTLLVDLLRLYRDGLREPLRFFPKASLVCAETDGDIKRAADAFLPRSPDPGWCEGRDPAVRLALRGVDDILDDRFVAVARRVYGPMLAHEAPAGEAP